MITITVNNFRIYTEERSFTFEYGKLFQLAGGSGEGKSTLLMAFEWCLYGTVKAVKPKSNQSLIPRVVVKIGGLNHLSIIRHGNDLEVTTGKGIALTGDAAQGHICNIFGDKDLWKCSSYLEAECRNVLLIGTGEEKLKILRSLVYGEVSSSPGGGGSGGVNSYASSQDPEYYLGVVSNAVSVCKKEKLEANAIYNAYYDETQKALDSFEKSDNKWAETDLTIAELRSRIKEENDRFLDLSSRYNDNQKYKAELEKLRQDLADAQTSLDSFQLDLNSLDLTEAELNEILNKTTQILKDLELYKQCSTVGQAEVNSEKYAKLSSTDISHKSWKSRVSRLGISDTSLYHLKKVAEYCDFKELNKIFLHIKDLKDFVHNSQWELNCAKSKVMNKEEEFGDHDIDILKYNLKVVETSIQDHVSKKYYTCPSCKDHLYMGSNGDLSKASGIDIDALKDKKTKIETLILLHKELLKDKKDYESFVKDVEDAKREFGELMDTFDYEEYGRLNDLYGNAYDFIPKVKDIDAFKVTLKNLISEYVEPVDPDELQRLANGEKISKLLGPKTQDFLDNPDLFRSPSKDGLDESVAKAKIAEAKASLASLKDRRSQYLKLMARRDALEKEILRTEERISSTKGVTKLALTASEKKLAKYRALEIDYIYYTEMESKITSLDSHQKRLETANKKLERLEALYELMKKLSIEPVEKLIDIINYKLNEYLDRLFTKDPIRIVMSLYKTSGGPKSSAFSKIAVNLNVYHRQNNYTSIAPLSSGEKDRVSLAMTLTMASLTHTPMIFLDECMASLDAYHRELCLTLMNELVDDSRIAIDVCPETVEGYHSEVVRIGPN